MKDLIKQYRIEQLIPKSTQSVDHNRDWIIVKKDYETVKNVAILDQLLSGHSSITIDLDEKKASPLKRTIKFRNMKGINIDQLSSDLNGSAQTVLIGTTTK